MEHASSLTGAEPSRPVPKGGAPFRGINQSGSPRPFTTSDLLRRPHLRELVDTGDAAPTLVIQPLRFFPITAAMDGSRARVGQVRR